MALEFAIFVLEGNLIHCSLERISRSGVASDRWKTNEATKLRVFNSLSCGLCGVLMLTMATMQQNYTAICVFLVVVTQGLIGFNSAGFNQAAVVVAR